jgi:DtxR family Mn-dependent transcriptional regulator
MPTSTVEDYLKQILLEEQRTGVETRVPTGRIAQQLAVTPGSATAMVQTLAVGGLVDYEAYGGVRLTDDGRRLALHVLRRHRLVELFLVEVMGYDWSEVHPEAERLEHAVSERLVERIDEMLGRPAFDPHGDPIPTAAGELVPAELELLSSLPEGSRARVARVGDQDAEFLRRLDSLGLTPGARLRVVARDESTDTLEVAPGARKQTASLGLRAAAKILVEPD